jgi:preprotein translocase subunit SecE
MSSKGVAEIVSELFRVRLHKSRQGRLVRRATFICFAVLAVFGCVALAAQLQAFAKYVHLGVPVAIWGLCCWIAFRAVNMPTFADFLISVEAELERVIWPGQQQVTQATIVVLVVMFSLGVFLTGADFVWKWLFELIGFIEY